MGFTTEIHSVTAQLTNILTWLYRSICGIESNRFLL